MSEAFAERLNHLFETISGPDGKPYSNEAVIIAIAAKGGPTISKGYLSELRSGKKTNPTLRHVEALAGFFDIDPAYFVGDDDYAERVAAELKLVAAMRRAGVRDIALRATGLSAQGLDVIASMIEKVRQLEFGGSGPSDAAGGDSPSGEG